MYKTQVYDLALFKTNLFTYLYVRVCIVFACGKTVRDRPLTCKRGEGLWLFSKIKYSDSQCCWTKYSDFGGGNKINLILSFCHILVT